VYSSDFWACTWPVQRAEKVSRLIPEMGAPLQEKLTAASVRAAVLPVK
jgi:hypothetical protein